jgi:hypothetical protein
MDQLTASLEGIGLERYVQGFPRTGAPLARPGSRYGSDMLPQTQRTVDGRLDEILIGREQRQPMTDT